ncbi:MAG: hypothetical protein ACJ8AW_43970 [Rhodopila sp.]
MNNDVIVITDTLNRVAARAGDPASLVFKRLFVGHPEAEDLFVRDDSGLVRGQMFQVTIESLLDSLATRPTAPRWSRSNAPIIKGLASVPRCSTAFT